MATTEQERRSVSPREGGGSARVDVAARRLDQAVARLEQRLALRLAEAGAQVDGLFDQDRSNLADKLDGCQARVRELEEVGAEASAALAEAIARMQPLIDASTHLESH
ncbi:MAG: DUF4164 family protein [Caulobacteraceae bacterium]